jgi:hypothetical protein
MIKIFLAFFLVIVSTSEAKLLVITHAYKRPDFIPLQEKTFRKFLKDDYEFVVFNDAREPKIYSAIDQTCKQLNIRCIPIPQEIHQRPYLPRMPGELYDHPCVTCANVVQYSLDTLGFDHNDLVMIIDSDMFLVGDLNVSEYMKDCEIAGHAQSRSFITYLWNGIVFFNMNTLPAKRELSFNCGDVAGQPCDVGGHTYYYFQKHPQVRKKFVNQIFVQAHVNEDTTKHHPYLRMMIEEGVPNSEFFLDYKLFHYRGGGNWDYQSDAYHRHKTAALHKLIDFAINSATENSNGS